MRISRTMLAARLAVASLLLAGCGGPGEQDGDAETGSAPAASAPTADPSAPDGPTGAPTAGTGGPPQVDAAVADLAERQGVEESDVRVEGVVEVTWPDGSLGCPRPGEMYTQALVEGLEIVLSVAGTRYAYHSSLEGEPFLCDQPAPRRGGGQTNSDG